jgi:hypothetical protein
MGLHLDLSQNNFDFFKVIFDKINFHQRILNLKERYSYYRNGKHVVDLKFDLERKYLLKLVDNTLKNKKIVFDFTKQENCFSLENCIDDYIFQLVIKIDYSIGGSLALINPERINPYHLWGSSYDKLLSDYYNYENISYRYCPVNEAEAIEIITEILKIYFDFLEVFKNQIDD